MKKRLLFALFCLAVGGTLLGAADPQPPVVSAKLVMIKGTVELRKAGTDEWKPANYSQIINQGDSIKTKSKSSVIIRYSTGTSVKLSSLTVYTFMKGTERAPRGELNLGSAFIMERLQKIAGVEIDSGDEIAGVEIDSGRKTSATFEIRTPTAYAGVRGTFFAVQASEQETQIDVFEGAVEVRGATAPEKEGVLVNEHMRTTVEAGNLPAEPTPIPKEEEEQLKSNFTDNEFNLSSYKIDLEMKPVKKGRVEALITVTSDEGVPSEPLEVELEIIGDAVFEANNAKKITVKTDDKGKATAKVLYTGRFAVDARLFYGEEKP